MSDKKSVGPYDKLAGGWDSLKRTLRAINDEKIPLRDARTLLRTNQYTGFDCPGCA